MISNKQLTAATTNLPIKFERDYKLEAAFVDSFFAGVVGERLPHATVEK